MTMHTTHKPILKKALLLMVCAFGLYASSCKKENTAAPVPVIDSSFVKFTSSVLFNGTLNYVAATADGSSNYREKNGSRTISSGVTEGDLFTSLDLYAVDILINGPFDPPQVQTPFPIPLQADSNVTWRCRLMLSFPASDPNRGNWKATGGTTTIVEIGDHRVKGYFSATLTNDAFTGKTIELKNGTFNFRY